MVQTPSTFLGRMVIIGVGMTALVCKPLFALCGSVHATLGTAACITWVTYAKVGGVGGWVA